MRFLLLNPFYPLAEMPSPPLGIGYLGASLMRAGIEVRAYDLVVSGYSRDKLAAIMADFQPDIVGATSVTMTFHSAISAIEDAKAIDPDVVTAMGGAHVSFCAEETLRSHAGLDVVARGEGEELIVELCQAVERGRDFSRVAGLVYRDGDDVRASPSRDTWLDVNTLPLPARELTPLSRYRALGLPISMTTSRGCPFQCIFCVGRKLVGAKVRRRDPVSVVDEMQHLAAQGFVHINLADDLFTANKTHAYGVCDEILRRGAKLSWNSFANVNTVDVPLLTRMREAGCTMVSFGLESANQEILKTVRKGTKVHRILSAVEACNEAGVRPHGSFIVGLPGETPETIRESIAFSQKLTAMGAQVGFHMLAPFPGTAVRDDAKRYKLRILTDDWSEYHANHAITETEGAAASVQQEVAAEIDAFVSRQFWELAERIEAGTASEDDLQRYAAVERQGVYYDMMMQDLLETRGSFVSDGAAIDEPQAVALLSDAVAGATGRKPDEVRRAIDFGLRNDLLRFESRGRTCSFRFADDPASLQVTEVVRRRPELARGATAAE